MCATFIAFAISFLPGSGYHEAFLAVSSCLAIQLRLRQLLSCITDPAIIAKHQPIIWGTDRIDSSYANIMALSTKPAYLLTFNEPNFAFGGGTPTNVVDPVTAAGLWPQITAYFDPLGIQLIAPSAIDCAGADGCANVGTAAGWLSAFQSVSQP